VILPRTPPPSLPLAPSLQVVAREPLMPFEARTSTESYTGGGGKKGTSRRDPEPSQSPKPSALNETRVLPACRTLFDAEHAQALNFSSTTLQVNTFSMHCPLRSQPSLSPTRIVLCLIRLSKARPENDQPELDAGGPRS
jgi:hypothetical protein